MGILSLIGLYLAISYSHLTPDIRLKKNKLDNYLIQKGYKTDYILLSGYRPPWLNKMMPLSAKKSVHQQGKAIDLLLFDINGNGYFDNDDLTIVSNALDHLDKKYPHQRGGVGLYHRSFPRMIHFDVSGIHRHWDY